MSIGHNSIAGDQLRSILERIERLEEEKKAIADDIKDVKREAKGNGFDLPTINALLKLRKLDPQDRDEQEALLDIYKAALGMLNDTPLGEAARRRLTQPKTPRAKSDDRQRDLEDPPDAAPADTAQAPPEPQPLNATPEIARQMGAEAARTGKPVTANPFPARDPLRAAWDEAWCSAAGSDGMDLPEAWKRTKKRNATPEKDAA